MGIVFQREVQLIGFLRLFLIVHHGAYWDMPRPLTGPVFERFATLIRGDCALYSSHLPLDGHPELGNNALIARQIGLGKASSLAHNGPLAAGRRLLRVMSASADANGAYVVCVP